MLKSLSLSEADHDRLAMQIKLAHKAAHLLFALHADADVLVVDEIGWILNGILGVCPDVGLHTANQIDEVTEARAAAEHELGGELKGDLRDIAELSELVIAVGIDGPDAYADVTPSLEGIVLRTLHELVRLEPRIEASFR